MVVKDVRVRRIINEALIRFSGEGGFCGPVRAAFRYLQSQRRLAGGSLDEEMAAAERDMFARYTVCVDIVRTTQRKGGSFSD